MLPPGQRPEARGDGLRSGRNCQEVTPRSKRVKGRPSNVNFDLGPLRAPQGQGRAAVISIFFGARDANLDMPKALVS